MPTLDFKGKQHIYAHHLTVPYRSLVRDAKRSVGNCDRDADRDGNLIIHGDNLHALKALLPQYAGKVKCIYIDPLYNTGNEGWRYNDNVNSPLMREWVAANSPVDGEDLERHDKWLCMMWPRLHLLRDLLSDDGAIFVSIDDHEQHHLRMLMDEIFGSHNFRNAIAVRRGVKNVQSQFEYVDRLNSGWEYILFYSKRAETRFQHLTTETDLPRQGKWNNHWRGSNRPTMRYSLLGVEEPESGQWRWAEARSLVAVDNYLRLLDELETEDPTQAEIDEWWFAQSPVKPDLLRLSDTGQPEHYVHPSKRRIVSSLWTDMTANEHFKVSNKLIGQPFDNPKRTELIVRTIDFICGKEKDAVVLDSFAGSGTTGHAVLALNKEDGGNRKFILVECEDYADTITAERVRRVIKGIPEATDASLKEGLGGSFTYCTLGKPIDVEEMLTGKNLPEYSELASYLLYTASGLSVDKSERMQAQTDEGLFWSSDDVDYYLLYRPNIEWLRSNEALLNEGQVQNISKRGKSAVVFAAGKHMGQRFLTDEGITFCQIPYEMHRLG